MTLLDYLKSNWEGVPIYFNTVKFDDYFINIVPFMLGNKVIKYDEDKNYNNGGDLFITDNTLLIEKAKKENFSIIILGDYPEGVEVSKNIRLISGFNKQVVQSEEELDLFEPYKLFLKMAGFENAKLFNFDEPIQGGFIPTTVPPPPLPLRKVELPSGPSSGQEKKFIPTTAPPPPPPLKKEHIPAIHDKSSEDELSQDFKRITLNEPQYIPTSPPQSPRKIEINKPFEPKLWKMPSDEEKKQMNEDLRSFLEYNKSKRLQGTVSQELIKPKSRVQFVPFVKGGMLEDTKDEFKYANIIKMKNNEYDYFPKRKDEYMYTDVSLYSSADVSHSLKTAELISKYYDISNKTLTEASACVGGNSWSFADKVKNINLIEIDKNNFKALKHNMGVVFNKDPGSFNKDPENNTLEYKAGKTMNFFNDNYIKIRDILGGDIIFYDPPWGGVDYKNEPQVGYSYNGKFYNLEEMSKKSFYKVPPELIVFRIPMSSNILNSDYKYETTIVFNDLYGKAIYKLVFLSDIKGSDLPGDIKVKRINYKKIEYEVV